jgi:hypothetical protein
LDKSFGQGHGRKILAVVENGEEFLWWGSLWRKKRCVGRVEIGGGFGKASQKSKLKARAI